MKALSLARFFAVASVWALVACDSGSADDSADTANVDPGADTVNVVDQPGAEEIRGCKDACDRQKFFDCNDAAQHATCYGDCGDATSSQIELFVGCVNAEACDPECNPYLVATDEPDPVVNECTAACDTVLQAGCIDAQMAAICNAACATGTAVQKALLVACVENREGCIFPEECSTSFSDEPAGY